MARVARRAYPVSCLGAVRVSVQQVLHLRFRVVVGNGIVQRQTSHLMRSNSWAWEGVLWAGLTSVGVHTSSAVVARVERSVAAAPQPRASPRSRAACTALGTNWSARLALALASPLIFCFMVRVASPHFKIAAGSRTLLRTTATPRGTRAAMAATENIISISKGCRREGDNTRTVDVSPPGDTFYSVHEPFTPGGGIPETCGGLKR